MIVTIAVLIVLEQFYDETFKYPNQGRYKGY